MLHTLVVYVEDGRDALSRVASVCRRRPFLLDSLTVGRTDTAGLSRMTVVIGADRDGARRLGAQLARLVDVVRVEDITDQPAVSRDLAMIKVACTPESRADIMQLVQVFRARVVDVAADSLIVETTGTEDKVDGLLQVLRPFGVLEMVRTGRVAMRRGSSVAGLDASPAFTTTAAPGIEPGA
jgi:acetolactate synthase I/III small subunit